METETETETEHLTTMSVDDNDSLVPEPSSTKESLLLEGISLINPELSSAGEVITKVELDMAFISEKLVNLNLLTMQIATKETDFDESFDDDEKALEFDLLSSILNSEVNELDSLLGYLHNEVQTARLQHNGQAFIDFELDAKFDDSEQSLRQLMEQVVEMKKQSYSFTRLSSGLDTKPEDNQLTENDDDFGDLTAKIEMQTTNQQRNVLRMLEKSLAKEMELEKKLTELINTESELKMKLKSSEQDVIYMEEVIEDSYSKLLEAENASEVFKGMSKEMSGKLQILKFSLSGSFKREDDLKTELDDSKEKLEAKESVLHKLDSSNARVHDFLMAQTEGLKESLLENENKMILLSNENSDLCDKVSLLEEQFDEYERINEELKEKLESVEKCLREREIQLEHAVAALEASNEKENLALSVVSDMEDVIDVLKSKVSKAECNEEKLRETNVKLTEEVRFVRGRLKEGEECLQRAEERQSRTAKDISSHNKIMKKLVMQLAGERERLCKQITNLARENVVLMVKLKKCGNMESEGSPKSSCPQESSHRDIVNSLTDPEEEEPGSEADIGTVRRLDVEALGMKKRILFAMFLMLTLSVAAYFGSQQNI